MNISGFIGMSERNKNLTIVDFLPVCCLAAI